MESTLSLCGALLGRGALTKSQSGGSSKANNGTMTSAFFWRGVFLRTSSSNLIPLFLIQLLHFQVIKSLIVMPNLTTIEHQGYIYSILMLYVQYVHLDQTIHLRYFASTNIVFQPAKYNTCFLVLSMLTGNLLLE
ncbi:hypothetical protein BCR42DRAFT_398619 [Absidia repens]|uniref:Uncharacterized protein n=1 Tax=Absidia repens TaxID=90262 RepID=A0A1X2HXU5_9FUNG|nr:hypothetical protein BCR42DRAFT_398619 [Absidia repens]